MTTDEIEGGDLPTWEEIITAHEDEMAESEREKYTELLADAERGMAKQLQDWNAARRAILSMPSPIEGADFLSLVQRFIHSCGGEVCVEIRLPGHDGVTFEFSDWQDLIDQWAEGTD